jgi:hypothetical protein
MRAPLKKFARKSAFLCSGAEPDLTSRPARAANQSPDQPVNQPVSLPAKPTLSKQKPVSLQWFHDYSVRRKQLILLLPGLLSILGLAGIATLLIVMTGRAQLRQQAESELAAAEINYSAKLNQMSGALADQPIVVAAAQASIAAATGIAAGVDANADANAATSVDANVQAGLAQVPTPIAKVNSLIQTSSLALYLKRCARSKPTRLSANQSFSKRLRLCQLELLDLP